MYMPVSIIINNMNNARYCSFSINYSRGLNNNIRVFCMCVLFEQIK